MTPSNYGPTHCDACSVGVSGPALAGTAFGAGELAIFTVGQLFNSGNYTIDLIVPTTQFGFEAKSLVFNPHLEFYLGDQHVAGLFLYSGVNCHSFEGFESVPAFDRVVIDTHGAGSYLLDTLFIPDLTPDDVPTLTLSKPFIGPTLHWTTDPAAAGYDVVRGKLLVLRSTSGDFAEATTTCLADDTMDSSLEDPWPPPPGKVRFYLVRRVNSAGRGTYDSGGPGQQADRDGEIADGWPLCP